MKRDEEIDRLQRQDVDLDGGRAERARPVRSLLEPGGAESDAVDQEGDMVGELDVMLDETMPAEDAAIHVVEEPPGANYDPDPGYVEPSK